MIAFILGLSFSLPELKPYPLWSALPARFPSVSPNLIDLQPIPEVVGGFITDLEVDPFNRNNIYAANGYEIFKSTDGGVTWRKLGIDLPLPKDMCAPTLNTLFLYSSDMGLLYSTDGGNSFNSIPGVPAGMKDAVFAIDTSGSGALWLALGDGNGNIRVYRGTISSWNMMGGFTLPDSGAPKSLFAYGNLVFVGIGGTGSLDSYPQLLVKLSVDSGNSWSDFWTVGQNGNVNDIEVVKISATESFLSFVTDRGIYYRYFSGVPLPPTRILPGPWSEMLALGCQGDTVFALMGRNGLVPGLLLAWFHIDSLPPDTVVDTSLLYNTEGITDIDFTTSVGIASTEGVGIILASNYLSDWHESNNGLLAWTSIGPYSLWSGNDSIYSIDLSGHLYRSFDAGRTWTRTGLNPLLFGIATAACPNHPDVVYAVALYIDSTGGGIILRSTDAGNTWTGMGGIDTQYIAFPLYLEVDPTNHDRLFSVRFRTSGQTLASVSTNAGTIWENITLPDSARCLEVAPEGTVFWGTKGGVYWGAYPNFTNRVDSLIGREIVGLFFDPYRGNLYAVDKGDRVWAGQPDVQASWRVIANTTGASWMDGDMNRWGDIILLITRNENVPVLLSTIDGFSWQIDSLPYWVSCAELVDTGRLIAGTLGRGLYWGSIPGTEPLSVLVSAEPYNLHLGDSCKVKVEISKRILDVPVCTLTTEGGDTFPFPLEPSDTTGRFFKGVFWTGGLHEGKGTISAVATDPFGNKATGFAEITIGPGPGEFMPDDSVYVYPNPAPTSNYGNYIYFSIFTNTEAEVDVLLYDLEGKPAGLVSGERITGGTSKAIPMDISRIPSGIYIWRLRARALRGSQSAEKMGKLAIRK
ncbi:MAG: hypothetical protein ABIM74_04665 [candidate division WOR-3 bacterium]